MILEMGKIIANRYEIAELIGAGGMSHVYRALDKKLHRSVTVKVLREEYIGDVNFVDRFGREARAIASLSHPNIVNVYDVGSEGTIHFIVMEYIAGKTLKELIIDKAPFSNETMLGVASQIAAALIHAHENGIIHRDIKPQNVLCMPNGVVKVADFGIAKSHDSKNLVDEFSTMGSVHYISPEVACGDPIDPRSDLYSLGIVMFEMMTGELPFDSDDADEITMLHVEAPFPNIRKRNPKVLPVVREIIVRLTNKQPFRRYQSASSLYTDIQRAVMESAEEDFREDTRADVRPSPFEQRPRPHEIPQSQPRLRPPMRSDVAIARHPAGRDRNQERLIILGGVVTAAVLIAGLIFLVSWLMGGGGDNGLVRVPAHMGMELEAARTQFEAVGLYLEEYEEREASDDVPEGHITQSEFPLGTEMVEPGTVVHVVVSSGPFEGVGENGDMIEVPHIVGMHLTEATNMIEDISLYLNPEDFRPDSNMSYNYILVQNPPAGRLVEPGTHISIVVSLGEEMSMVSVPDLVGLLDMQARTAIVQAGLNIGNAIPVDNHEFSPGIVVWQSAAAGTEVFAGSIIDFHLSAGPLTPPDEDEDDPDEANGADENGENGDQNGEVAPPDENGQENGYNDVPGDDVIPPDDPNDGQLPPEQGSRTLTLNPFVPDDVTAELVLLRRELDGSLTPVLSQQVTGIDLPLEHTVFGTGTVEFIIQVDGVPVGDQTVTFN
jgi:serine/threonine-protein kinase